MFGLSPSTFYLPIPPSFLCLPSYDMTSTPFLTSTPDGKRKQSENASISLKRSVVCIVLEWFHSLDSHSDSVKPTRIVRWRNVPSILSLFSNWRRNPAACQIKATTTIPTMDPVTVMTTMDSSHFVVHRSRPTAYIISWRRATVKVNWLVRVRMVTHTLHVCLSFLSLVIVRVRSFPVQIAVEQACQQFPSCARCQE